MKLNTPMVASSAAPVTAVIAVVHAGRDQMRADQTVGRSAADEIGAGEQPEVPHPRALAQRAEGQHDGIAFRRLSPASARRFRHRASGRRSDGRSRMISATSGRTTQTTAAMQSTVVRQP